MNGKKIALKVIVAVVLAAMILAVVPIEAEAYTYNRQASKNYALKWWNSANPGYKNFGSDDCTNFVSQCVRAGGWPERGKYKYWSSSSWYYDWGRRPGYSNTWTVANDFSKFLAIYSWRGRMYSLRHKPWNRYFQVGDIVQIDYSRDGRWDHTMIVTKIDSNDMYMTYHSRNTRNKPLTQIMAKYPNAQFMGYQLYNSFSR